MKLQRLAVPAVALLALTVSLAARPSDTTVKGQCAAVFGGDVCTWGTMTGERVVDFGATVPLASVEHAPAGGEMTFPPKFVAIIALPAEITAATGFDHLGVNWEPHGHPPALFLTPHFDFHFYAITPDRVRSIDCADLSKPTDVPAGYTLPDVEIPGMGSLVGLCVPQMGMHAMLQEEIDDTEPFGASMILGYYRNEPIFIEPMISRAKLLDARSFTVEVPAVTARSSSAKWPTKFVATYDESARAYRFVFSGFPAE